MYPRIAASMRALVLRERGRVEHDGVELLPLVERVAEEVEGVGRDHVHVAQLVALRVGGDLRAGGVADLHRGHLLRLERQLQGEAAHVAEAVQRLAEGPLAGHHVVVALVEEGAGLLAGEQVHLERHVAFAVGDRPGELAAQHALLRLQPFQPAHVGVAAVDDRLAAELLGQQVGDELLALLGGLVEELHRQKVAEAVHHQPGQQVGLAVHHPVGGLVGAGAAAQRVGGDQPRLEEVAVDRPRRPTTASAG